MKINKGFTLIELLVVISIIGILSSVILASLNSARSKARDARRITDLQQIQIALELYYSNNGQYPRYDDYGAGTLTCPGDWATLDSPPPDYIPCWNDLQTKLAPYINKLPIEVIGNSSGYHYRARNSQNNGQGYYLLMYPEDSSTYKSDSNCFDAQGSLWWCLGNNWE